jgi:ParB-like chromosome segregation protein Spo0J
VAQQEMKLLHISIEQDGYTQPVVTIYDSARDRYEIVDGYHRYTVMKMHRDIAESTGGYLPVVVIDKPVADRIASTVRHNRARGKHSVAGMSSLVFRMLEEGEPDEVICDKIGLEPEELARLKYITGFAKLHSEHTYPRAFLTDRQQRAKATYKREHPDETIPTNI